MKTAKELFERLKTDEAFAKEFSEALTAKREAGAKSYYETIIPVAEERGYMVTKEDIDEMLKVHDEELSPDELGKVAGGASCIAVFVGSAFVLSVGVVSYDMVNKYINRPNE